eukprot:695140_1
MSLFLDPEAAKRFECAICFEIYKEPVQVGCEEHLFCNQCVKDLISEKGSSFDCPLCRKICGSKSVTRVKFIDRQINDLKVQCPNAIKVQMLYQNESTIGTTALPPNKENNAHSGQKRKRSYDDDNTNNKKRKLNGSGSAMYGCEWKGRYSELNKHRTTCPLEVVICEFCDQSMLQRNLKKHHGECPHFPMQCVECEERAILRINMATHIARFCPMTRIPCSECKEEIQRKNQKLHDENECSEALIECVFHSFGCKEKLKRKDEKKHVLSAAFTHSHLMQVAKKQTKLEQTVKTLKKEKERLTERIIALEKLPARMMDLERKVAQNKNTIHGLPKHIANAKLMYVMNGTEALATYDKDRNIFYPYPMRQRQTFHKQ